MADIAPLVTVEDYQSALETTLCTLESLLCTGGHEPHAQTLADADQWLDACRRALDETKAPRSRIRFEERVEIALRCFESGCNGSPMKLMGNMSLREAGADATRLAYECERCFRRVMVTDAWSQSTPAIDAAHDQEP